jgi:hypothetical protein
MRRREFIIPLAARAQQPEQMPRIGILMNRPRTQKVKPVSRLSKKL